jgi:hypothetical protein
LIVPECECAHVHPDVRGWFLRSDEARRRFITRPKYVPTKPIERAVARLREGMEQDRLEARLRNVAVIGDSFMGKTTVFRQVRRLFPPRNLKRRHYPSVRVLNIDFTYRDVIRDDCVYDEILTKLSLDYNVPFKPKDKFSGKQHDVLYWLGRYGTRALAIDEASRMAAKAAMQRMCMALCIYLNNQAHLNLLLMGTRELFNVIHKLEQTASRFDVVHLKRWRLDQDFLVFVDRFEGLLPLRNPSNIARDTELCELVLELAEGVTGEIASLIQGCAAAAVGKGERVTYELLQSLDYTPPSQRRLLRIEDENEAPNSEEADAVDHGELLLGGA